MDNTKAKILLLDDEANTLKVISAILRKRGYEVFTSMTAEEAMGRLTTLEPDTVIADYKLPGMNGVEACRALRNAHVDAPVILQASRGARSSSRVARSPSSSRSCWHRRLLRWPPSPTASASEAVQVLVLNR